MSFDKAKIVSYLYTGPAGDFNVFPHVVLRERCQPQAIIGDADLPKVILGMNVSQFYIRILFTFKLDISVILFWIVCV